MLIVHVVNTSDTGGAQTLVEALAERALPQQEIHVAVLSNPGVLADRLSAVAASVTHFGSEGRSIDVLGVGRGLSRLLRSLSPDIVHSHLFQSNLLAGAVAPRRAKQVWTIHTSGHGDRDKMRTRLVIRALGAYASRADAVVACSPSAERWVGTRSWRGARVSTIPNGVVLRTPHVPSSSGEYLLSLARAHEMKDHSTLMQAFEMSRATALKCAGLDVAPGNPLIDGALALIGPAARDRVELLGSVSDPSNLMAGASALVISSAYGEALPMAALEALAAGVPVVTTDVGDCRAAAVRPELLVPPRSPSALAGAIDSVVGVSDFDRSILRDEALERAKEFDVDRVVARYDDLYKEVCGVR